MNDELPPGWASAPLRDLLGHTIGGIWGKPIDEDEVNVRVLRVTEFGKHTVLEPETGVVRAVSAKQLASRQLQLGDILLEKSGGGPNQPVGRVVAFRTHLAEPAVPTNFVQLLRPSREVIDPALLAWTLDWWHKNGTAEAHQRATTNIRNLQTKAYLAHPVALPPLAEQKRIVTAIEEHFSRLEFAEAALEAARAKLQALRQSVLAAAFSGRLTNPSHTTNTDPGQLPDGWTLAQLDDICEVTLGHSPPGTSYNEVGNGVPFFQGKAEFGDHFPEVRKWTTEPKKRALAGSILISVRAPVGPTNVAPVDCAIGRGLGALRPVRGNTTEYVLWAIRSTATDLVEQATGSTFEAVTGKQLRAHRIPVAPLAEQEQIVAAIKEHFSVLTAAETALDAVRAKVSAFRRSVLVEAFAGRLVPQDPDDEPATALLAHIAAERPVRPTSRKRSK